MFDFDAGKERLSILSKYVRLPRSAEHGEVTASLLYERLVMAAIAASKTEEDLGRIFSFSWDTVRYLTNMNLSNDDFAKLTLAVSAVASLGLLAYCKYADFFIGNFNAVTGLSIPLLRVALPVGISFYTFQILSYVIDVYRGDVPAQRNFIDLAMYVAMFPQLIAGPIVRYSDIAGSLKNRKTQQETMLRQITDPTADIRSLSAAPLSLPREFPPQLSAGSRLKMQAIITIM